MTQASEDIARQYFNANLNKRTWGEIAYVVSAFSIVGDGVTDVTASLQALINLAISEGRKTIFFPHGEYYVTSLTNADQVYLLGDNASFVGGYAGKIDEFGGYSSQLGKIYWLTGKTINVFGDSMSDPNVTSNAWPTLLPDLLGVAVNNYSVSGKRISGPTGFAATMGSYTAPSDVNIVMLGVNDFWNDVDIGQKTSTNTDEFYGAVNVMFKYISEHWPSSLNCVVMEPKVEAYSGGLFGTERFYQYIIFKVAKKYGFLVFDLYNALPNYNPAIPALKTLYAPDGMHPNTVYQPVIADIMSRYLTSKRSDNFSPEVFDISRTLTMVITGDYRGSTLTIDTNDKVTYRFNGTGLAASNIVSNNCVVQQMHSFTRTAFPTLMQIYGNINNSAIQGVLQANNNTISFAYYAASPTDPFALWIEGSWTADYL